MLFEHLPVVIRGGGDLASGAAYRLIKAGFPVMITELAHPLVVRRTVAFASAIYEGCVTVEGITARRVDLLDCIAPVLAAGEIPVLVDETGSLFAALKPVITVDARMIKHNPGTTIHDAALVIALGPGYQAGQNCHAVIETRRGHNLGRVIWQGAAEPNTGQPGSVEGYDTKRVLRAPVDGMLAAYVQIGDRLREGDQIAAVEGVPVRAPFDGVLRGLIHPSVKLAKGMKMGDVDPRGDPASCLSISDKSLAIGGGVVEAVLSAPQFPSLLERS